MIAARAMAVLKAVVDEYVGTCAPVGSKALVDHHRIGYSSATVRSDLAGLERSGHLTHPHVSAGRVPTDLGYRTVVAERLSAGRLASAHLRRETSQALDLRSLARTLAQVTHCLAVVSEPAPQQSEIAGISLTPLPDGRVMLVVVMGDGRVASRSLLGSLPREGLGRVAECASELVVGEAVTQASEGRGLGAEERRFLAQVVQSTLALVASVGEAKRQSSGMAFLLAQPEFKDPDVVRVVADALEESDLALTDMELADEAGLMVSIGQENPDERLQGLSVVAKEYHAFSGVGYVACVGPTRMDYPLVIGAVLAGADRAQAILDPED